MHDGDLLLLIDDDLLGEAPEALVLPVPELDERHVGGAVRGGGVSGIGGHNAAMAVLETR